MDRRPTRIEFFFSLTFIFVLILAIASFFYGVKVGTEQTEKRFNLNRKVRCAEQANVMDDEQVIVSVNHTVLLPYRKSAPHA